MALLATPRREQDVELRGPARRVRDAVQNLAFLWLVRAPRSLVPWVPQLSDALVDGAWTSAWRGMAGLTPLVGLVVGFLTPILWPGTGHAYSDSPFFLATVVAGAILSGPVGLTLLGGYATGDLLSGGGPIGRSFYASLPHNPIETALKGGGSQLVSYILLAIPAVSVPRLARSLTSAVPRLLADHPRAWRVVQSALFALTCAALVFLWCQSMTVLARPIFSWRGVPLPQTAVDQFASQGSWLVAVAGAAALARVLLNEAVTRSGPWKKAQAHLQQLRRASDPLRGQRWRQLPALMRIGMPSGIITLGLAGAYDGWTDALLVAAATTLLGAWRAGLVARFSGRLVGRIHRVSALLRLGAVLAAGYLGYAIVGQVLPSSAATHSSRPMLSGILVALTACHALFPRRLSPRLARAETWLLGSGRGR